MSLEDDSLEGSIIIQENPIIKEEESKYKYGVEHRFYLSPEKKFVADKPIFTLFNKNNRWRTISEIINETGMAERTLQYACRRFVKHEIFEEKKLAKKENEMRRKNTRLYRLTTKGKNDLRRNPRKYENHKKRQSRSNR